MLARAHPNYPLSKKPAYDYRVGSGTRQGVIKWDGTGHLCISRGLAPTLSSLSFDSLQITSKYTGNF
jgi:hypothetical protein